MDNSTNIWRGIVGTLYATTILFGADANVNAQTSDLLPESTRVCQRYIEGDHINYIDSGFFHTQRLTDRLFEIKPDSSTLPAGTTIIGLNWNYILGESFMEGEFDYGEAWQKSAPLIDYFLTLAISDIDGIEYLGVDEQQLTVTMAELEIAPILRKLVSRTPKDAAISALTEMIGILEEGETSAGINIPEITRARKSDFEIVLSEMSGRDLIYNPVDGRIIDVVLEEDYEEMGRIYHNNWEALKNHFEMPEEIWDFLEERGYYVEVLLFSELEEGIGGSVSGNKITIGFDGTSINKSIIDHEMAHVLRNILNYELSEFVNFELPDGSVVSNFDIAFAEGIKYMYKEDYRTYPIFREIMSYVLDGSHIFNKNFTDRASIGYTNLLEGDLTIKNDPSRFVDHRVPVGNGWRGTLNEATAMAFEHILRFCFDENTVPPYIYDLYNFDRIVEAINNLHESTLEG